MVSEFSASHIKKLFGINNRTLQSFDLVPRTDSTKKGRPTDYYDFREVLDKYLDYKDKLRANIITTLEGEQIDGELEQALYTRSRREAQELKNEIARGEQAPIAVLAEALNQITSNLRTSLTSIPLNIKYKHPDINGVVIKHVERELIAASNAMSSQGVDWSSLQAGESEPD